MINLLAISGKIGSGKDTIGKIVQYLVTTKLHFNLEDINEEDFKVFCIESNNNAKLTQSGWEIKKFGGKLKQIVALLIGCTVQDLESQEFKSSPLGKEWNRFYYYHYKLRIDSSNGRVSPYFSTYEEAILYEFPKLDGVPIWGKDSLWIEEEKLTPRLLLQLIGTESLRNLIHPNAHVNGLFADYKENSNWIVTDTRFLNEVKAIKERNGIVIRVNRKGIDNSSTHESEIALDNFDDFDYIVNNDSTIDDLIKQVKRILEAEFII